MNYIGSKFTLSSFLEESIKETLKENNSKPLSENIFCDLFTGTAAVSKIFKNQVNKIIANDKEYYSFVIAKNYIGNNKILKRKNQLIDLLNNLKPVKSKIFINYAPSGGNERQYFSDYNAMKIDAIRLKIEEWKNNQFINDNEYFFLLASLLESADKVANTASVYGAFLKHIKKSAQKEIVLKPAEFDCGNTKSVIFNEDANNLITKIKGDILYLDPPYNSREYGTNYHLLNTIALYDNFTPKGKTGLREYDKSNWCKKDKVYKELETLTKNTNFKFIFLSYNDEGLLSLKQIKEIFESQGKYSLKNKTYKRFKADNNRFNKKDETTEYLHILIK